MAMVSSVVTQAMTQVTILAGRVLTETPTPSPTTPAAEMTESELANRMPGLPSFIVFVFLAVILYFLLRNMNSRLRRMSYREKEREAAEAEREAETAAREAEIAEARDAGDVTDAPDATDTRPPAPEAGQGESRSPHTDR